MSVIADELAEAAYAAVELINQLAEQQAMPSDWYVQGRDRLARAVIDYQKSKYAGTNKVAAL